MLRFAIILYIAIYVLGSLWLLIEGWLNNFSSLNFLWGIEQTQKMPDLVQFAFTTALGSVLGGAILSFISFHRYVAIEKNFDDDHSWGFFLLPILSIVIGIVVFALVQGGLIILSGSLSSENSPKSAYLGFTAIGCIAGYNWDKVASQLQKLSGKLLDNDASR